jgi:hypothetical protein
MFSKNCNISINNNISVRAAKVLCNKELGNNKENSDLHEDKSQKIC